MKNFTGKVAVITGGGSGIGKALAMAAAKRGMKLALLDIQGDALAQSVDELHQMGAVALGITADVSDAAAMQTVAEQIEAHYGAIHVVFNNAGVTSSGPVWESTEKDWDWLLGINLKGVVNGLRGLRGQYRLFGGHPGRPGHGHLQCLQACGRCTVGVPAL